MGNRGKAATRRQHVAALLPPEAFRIFYAMGNASGVVSDDRILNSKMLLPLCCLERPDNCLKRQQSSNEAETKRQHVAALLPLPVNRLK
jgi:hypothetical protein